MIDGVVAANAGPAPRDGTTTTTQPGAGAQRLSQRELVLQSLVRCPTSRRATSKR